MKIVLLSCYEMGRQPFGLASPLTWLAQAGHDVVCADLAVQAWNLTALQQADLIAFYLPMHTATRLALPLIVEAQRINPQAHLCCYGLYAPLNEAYLRTLGVSTVLGGEFEAALLVLADSLGRGEALQNQPAITLERLRFQIPDRSQLPPPRLLR